MKTYQLDTNTQTIWFTNYDRRAESEIFSDVIELLMKNANVEMGKKQIGPSENFYKCTLSGKPFTLYRDMDYGASIYSESQDVIQKLITYFN